MVENGKKHRQNSHPILHCPTSERCERTDDRVAQYSSLYSSLFWPTVQAWMELARPHRWIFCYLFLLFAAYVGSDHLNLSVLHCMVEICLLGTLMLGFKSCD